MRDWKLWDWLAFTSLWTVVVIEAAETSVKLSPTLSDLIPPVPEVLGFVPLALLIFATAIYVWRAIRPRKVERAGLTAPNLRPLIEAIERHAASEHQLSLECGHGVVNAGQPLLRGIPGTRY